MMTEFVAGFALGVIAASVVRFFRDALLEEFAEWMDRRAVRKAGR